MASSISAAALAALHAQVAAACPIDGIAVIDPTNPSSWRIDFQASATSAQKSSAQAIVTAYNVGTAPALVALAAKVQTILDAGYQPPGLATIAKALALDPASEQGITAQAAAADIAILKAGGGAVATTYVLPCADGTTVTASAADTAAAGEACRIYVQSINVNAASLGAAISASSNPAGVDITQGWPST
jgi:hypothetical protein